MGTGLLLAALMTIGPFAAGEDFYGQNPVLLLNDPKIAPLMRVTEDQKPALKQDLNDYLLLLAERMKLQSTKMRAEFDKRREAGKPDPARMSRPMKTVDPEVAEFDARMEAVQQASAARLTPEQYQRLRELAWQSLGIDAFSIQRYVDKLGMTNADIAMARPLVNEYVAKARELNGRTQPGRAEARKVRTEAERAEAQKALAAAEQEIIARIVSQLQPSTRATYENFAGEPGGFSRFELRKSFGVEPVVARKWP